MDILSKLTDEMQGVLTQSADNKAIETGFVKRKRKVRRLVNVHYD